MHGTAARTILVVEQVSKTFPGVRALDHVDFDLRSGEIHAVVGENGAGKTTLMMILSGVYRPEGGRVLLGGEEARIRDTAHAQRLGISTVFQELSLIPGLTVAENIFPNRVPTRGAGIIDWRRLNQGARQVLGLLGVQIDPGARVRDLTMSLRQMVEIAKALSLEAKVLLLDEPTSSLSEPEAARLFGVLRQLRQQGLGIVIITHRVSEIFALADRITVLRDGRKVLTAATADTTPEHIVTAMVGREVLEVERAAPPQTGPPLLEVANLRTALLGGVTVSVRPGEILGVAGLEGSGRSDLARALFGAERILGGEVRVAGRPVRLPSPAAARRHGIAYLPPDRKTSGLFLRMSILYNIASANLDAVSTGGLLRHGALAQLAEAYRSRLSIRSRGPDQVVGTLSGGNQQKVILARWLATRPRIFIIDDPTVGVDTGAKAEIHRILVDLAAKGTAVVLVSSELTELMQLSHRIMVMRAGRVAGIVSAGEFSEQAIVRLAAAPAAPGQRQVSAHVAT